MHRRGFLTSWGARDPQVRYPVVTRAAEKSRTNRIIGVICPLLPPRVFAKYLPISKMIGRGGGDRIHEVLHIPSLDITSDVMEQ